MPSARPAARSRPCPSNGSARRPPRSDRSNDYAVVVRNACNIPVQQVLVRVRLAGAASVLAAEPKAVVEDNVLSWDVGTLQPKQEKALQLKMAAAARGDVAAQAWVTFTGLDRDEGPRPRAEAGRQGQRPGAGHGRRPGRVHC